MAANTDIVLEFELVRIEVLLSSGKEVREFSFALEPGSLVLIENKLRPLPLADIASGLIHPSTGRVRFRGRDWSGMRPSAAAAARGEIGRVSLSPGGSATLIWMRT